MMRCVIQAGEAAAVGLRYVPCLISFNMGTAVGDVWKAAEKQAADGNSGCG